MNHTRHYDISAASLHILAMALMLCDHLWATIIPGAQWLNSLGRIAYPIFAFMLVEGFYRTHSRKKYALRLLICALISEIPFNLMYNGSIIYPYHQNVIWTFLIGLGMMALNEKARATGKIWIRILTAIGTLMLGFAAGFLGMTDYFGVGVVTILVFYFFHGRKWWNLVAQILIFYYLNVEILSGLYFDITIFGHTVSIVQQGLALLALIPIWLYKGRQGYHSKGFQFLCYSFYPLHMLILALVALMAG